MAFFYGTLHKMVEISVSVDVKSQSTTVHLCEKGRQAARQRQLTLYYQRWTPFPQLTTALYIQASTYILYILYKTNKTKPSSPPHHWHRLLEGSHERQCYKYQENNSLPVMLSLKSILWLLKKSNGLILLMLCNPHHQQPTLHTISNPLLPPFRNSPLFLMHFFYIPFFPWY